MFAYLNRWSLSSYITALLILLPVGTVLFYAVGSESDTLAHLKETVLLGYVTNTLMLLFGTGVLALILGVGTAYLTSFYTFRFEKFFVVALALPFVIPTYISGFIYSDLLGYFGPVHLMLKSMGVEGFFNVLNIYAVMVIMALALYPYVYLIVKASFAKSRAALLNPALSLGATKWQLLSRVILPLSRPAIVGGLSLVIMESISEYGVVKYYGVDTLSTAIFTAWFGLNDPQSAAYISVMAMLMILIVLLVERFSRNGASYKTEKSSAEAKKEKLGGIGAVFGYLFLSIPVLFGFIIPFLWILFYSYEYAAEVVDEEYVEVIVNSFIASGASALIIVALAVLIGYAARIYPYGFNRYLSKIASLGYAMPGAVVAVGVIILLGDIDNWLIGEFGLSSLLFSGTLLALMFGYVARFLAVALNTVDTNFERIGISVNRASRSLGRSYLGTLWRVELPLMRGALLFGFLLVFVDTIKELPATLILRPFNYETLSTKTYELATSQMVQESSVYALTIIVIAFVPMIITTIKAEH